MITAADGGMLSDGSNVFLLVMLGILAVFVIIAVSVVSISGVDASDAFPVVVFGVFMLIFFVTAAVLPSSPGGRQGDGHEYTVVSQRKASDVRLCNGRAVGSLMKEPRDGSWPVTYKDQKGTERTGTAEVTGSKSGSPVLKVTDAPDGRPCAPR